MQLADIILYSVWFAFPGFYLLAILYALLEKSSGRNTRDDIGDYLKQFVFLIVCVFVCIGLDKMFIPWFANDLLAGWLPLGFFRIVAFPCVLLVLGKLIGPSKTIKINKVTRVGDMPHNRKK